MHIPQSLYSSMRFNFLYADRHVFRRSWTYPDSYVPYCMLRYILKGRAEFVISGTRHIVEENQVCYIPEGCRLECRAREDAFSFISIRFTTTIQLDGSDFLNEYFRIPRVTRQGDEEVLGCFQAVYLNAATQNVNKLFRIRGNLELILAHTDMSPSSLRPLFKGHTGKSPGAFVRDLRMTAAARLLLVADRRISAIAYELGFDDANYFARIFKSTFGVSPQEYRAAIATADAATRSLRENRKVKVSEITEGNRGQ